MDGGYAGDKLEVALQTMDEPTIKIVKRPNGAKGFVVIVPAGSSSALCLARPLLRLAKDWEATIASSDAWLPIASGFMRRNNHEEGALIS